MKVWIFKNQLLVVVLFAVEKLEVVAVVILLLILWLLMLLLFLHLHEENLLPMNSDYLWSWLPHGNHSTHCHRVHYLHEWSTALGRGESQREQKSRGKKVGIVTRPLLTVKKYPYNLFSIYQLLISR